MKYMPYIDGIRGIAILTVLLFHLGIASVPGGFIGVDIFFVISGYLITSIIARELRDGRFSFVEFYARRVRRIFPALFAMLLVTAIAAVLTLGLQDYIDFFRSFRAAVVQLGNIYFDRNVDYFNQFQESAPLLHTWSLGVEEQFYLFWPLLLWLGLKAGREKVWPIMLGGVFIVSLAISIYWVEAAPRHAFYQLPSRAWQLALGGLVALNVFPRHDSLRLSNALAAGGVVMIAIAALCYSKENFPGIKALLPSVGTALIFYAAQGREGIVHKMLAAAPLRWTGLISYSLYLWHWPVICFYTLYTREALTVESRIALAGVSVVLAILSYVFVEQPVRRIKGHARSFLIGGVLTIVVFLGAAQMLKGQVDAPWRTTYHPDEFEALWQPYDMECSSGDHPVNNPACIVGPDKDAYEVLLAGDSTASHYMPMVLKWAGEKGLTVRQLTRSACPTWFVRDETPMRFGRPDTLCMEQSEAFQQAIKSQKSVRYVFVAVKTISDSPTLERSIKALGDIKAKVVFLGVGPHFAQDPHRCLARQGSLYNRLAVQDEADCLALKDGFMGQLDLDKKRVTTLLAGEGISYFEPRPELLKMRDGQGRLMFMDDYHLNRYGSEALAPSFKDHMKKHGR